MNSEQPPNVLDRPSGYEGTLFAVHQFMTSVRKLERSAIRELRNLSAPPVEYKWGPRQRGFIASSELKEWCTRWNLDGQSIYQWVMSTVDAWSEFPALKKTLSWPPPKRDFHTGWPGHECEDPTNLLSVVGAHPDRETRAEFLKRAKDHWNERVADLQEVGWKPIRRKVPNHFAWAVRYQLKKERLATIARDVHQDLSTVRDGVNTALKMIGVKPRKGDRGGAPRKQRPR
jgi:hypothetical protein